MRGTREVSASSYGDLLTRHDTRRSAVVSLEQPESIPVLVRLVEPVYPVPPTRTLIYCFKPKQLPIR